MIILDNFLPDGPLKGQLSEDFNWTKSHPYRWLDSGKKPSSIWESLAYEVWNGIFAQTETVQAAGFEYWTNALTAEGRNDLDWHFDKDEHKFFGEEKILLTPYKGMVYYCHKEMPTGGFLEIERGNGEVERIEPVPNRLIIFDPSVLHRVTPITSGVRRTFASNLWLEKPAAENFV